MLEYDYIKEDTDLFQIVRRVYERHNDASDFLRRFSRRIQLFEDKKIRTAWDPEKEEWYI